MASSSKHAPSAVRPNMEHGIYSTTQTQSVVRRNPAIKRLTKKPTALAQARKVRERHNGPMGHSMAFAQEWKREGTESRVNPGAAGAQWRVHTWPFEAPLGGLQPAGSCHMNWRQDSIEFSSP